MHALFIYFYCMLIDMIDRFIYVHFIFGFNFTNNDSMQSSIAECKTICIQFY